MTANVLRASHLHDTRYTLAPSTRYTLAQSTPYTLAKSTPYTLAQTLLLAYDFVAHA